ncbi:NAD(P)-dependent oxidoreductase [Nocardia rhizosphaerae]|uniref:NAD(P)-dependent oxidoreductase n=1 Tax=Nocardia rhizosphaerae TaxID=1691571 RepID=A0ABV8LBA2_9NOCA
MTNSGTTQRVSVIGLGAMGAALAQALLRGGHRVTVWNRTPAKAEALVGDGAVLAATAADAMAASDLVILCVLDDAAVREHLEPAAERLRGRTVVNLTTTTPEQARSLGAWAGGNGIDLIDGGIMAVPAMIGGPRAFVLYSGATAAFERYREVLGLFGRAEWAGADFGAAAMYDLAILGGMYSMFAGFQQGGRMVRTTGGTATHLATLMAPFLQAMAGLFGQYALGIDDPASYVPEQSADFTVGALRTIATAADESGTASELFEVLLKTVPGI